MHDKNDVKNMMRSVTKRFFIRNGGTGRNMKCARVAKRIQVRSSNGNCTRQTYGSKFIYSTARDRRSLVSVSDANTEAWVCNLQLPPTLEYRCR